MLLDFGELRELLFIIYIIKPLYISLTCFVQYFRSLAILRLIVCDMIDALLRF
jgi:hypothetical protein